MSLYNIKRTYDEFEQEYYVEIQCELKLFLSHEYLELTSEVNKKELLETIKSNYDNKRLAELMATGEVKYMKFYFKKQDLFFMESLIKMVIDNLNIVNEEFENIKNISYKN